MPKQTRKERLRKSGEETPPAGAPAKPVFVPSGVSIRQVYCPACGRTGGNYGFWMRKRFDNPEKPFGVIQEVGLGRGKNFAVIGYFTPEDEPELFDAVKQSLIEGVREWLDRGWITSQDLEGGNGNNA